MKLQRPLTLLTLSLLLGGCQNLLQQAPVEDRRPVVDTRKPEPVAEPKDERSFYTVKKGDTLLRIALDYGQNYRDLVSWNNLSDPNDIKVDQVLRVAPPDDVAGAGVTTSPIHMPPAETKPVVPRKVTPKAEKRPYTDAALADAKGDGKPDGKPDNKPEKPDAPDPVVAKPGPGTLATGSVVTATADEKLSWMWPSDGKIVATFDEGKNKGVDIAGRAGQNVMAAGAGKVMYAGSGIRGYGNLVIVKHSNNLLSAYAHNRAITVKEGQSVSKGQVIAEMGDSDADSVKLHFEIRQQGKPVDPARFLPSR